MEEDCMYCGDGKGSCYRCEERIAIKIESGETLGNAIKQTIQENKVDARKARKPLHPGG